MADLNTIIALIKGLSNKDKKRLIKSLENDLGGNANSIKEFLTDKRFTMDNGIQLVAIRGGKGKKNGYHIQHINSYHSRLKTFMDSFKGINKVSRQLYSMA